MDVETAPKNNEKLISTCSHLINNCEIEVFENDNKEKELTDMQPILHKNIQQWTKNERQWWTMALFIGQATILSSRTLVPICSVSISKEFGWNKAQMGVIMGMFFWGYVAPQYIAGVFADRVGGEQILTLAAFGWAFITIGYTWLNLYVFSHSWLFSMMIVIRVLHGFFQGFHSPSVGSLMANRVCLNKRGTTFTFQRSGTYFGILLTGSLGSLLVERCGWRIPFFCTGILSFLWAAWTRYRLMTDKDWITSMQIVKLLKFDHSAYHEWKKLFSIATQSKPHVPKLPFKVLCLKKEFWAMLLGHFAYSYAHFIILNWLPTYFHDNFPEAKGWIFNVVPWVVTIPTSMCGGIIADSLVHRDYSISFVRKFLETLSLVGTGTFLLILCYTTTYFYALVFMAMAVAFSGFHCGGILLNPQDLAPNHGGSLFGIMNIAGALPGFLGVYIAGFILEATGNWISVFQQTSFICFIGWTIFTIFGGANPIV